MVNIKINGVPMQAAEGSTVLEAARANGIKIPTLCYLKDVNAIGACRVCLVEIKGARALAAACVMPINEGMEIYTNTDKVRKARKFVVELILADHDRGYLHIRLFGLAVAFILLPSPAPGRFCRTGH